MTDVKMKTKRGEKTPRESEGTSQAEKSWGYLCCMPPPSPTNSHTAPCPPPCPTVQLKGWEEVVSTSVPGLWKASYA